MSSACPVFAFSVHLQPPEGSDDRVRRSLIGAFLQFTSSRGLDAVLLPSDTVDFVVAGEALQASDADRVAVERWLRERNDLTRWTVGELRDLQDD